MMRVRTRETRGHTRIDWLDSYHTFSFGDYTDPEAAGFSDLQVINDDIVQPGKGFETHGHSDTEIITYVLEGTLAHKDSLENGSLIQRGDVQRMSAGTGVLHSEFNPSDTDPVHFLQIWLRPDTPNLSPSYEQKTFDPEARRGCWQLIASRDGRERSITVHQDIQLWATLLPVGAHMDYQVLSGRACWVHVATGALQLNGRLMEAGDGAALDEPGYLMLEGLSRESEVLLFDLRHPDRV
jgi:redox-sensitive bicupin YhaK (pirin superfamily)